MRRIGAFFSLLIIVVSLIGAAPAVLQGERENPKYKYRPFVPVLMAGEKLQYRVNWKGLKIGYMNLTTGKKPKGTSPWIVYFSTKSNRLSKMPFMYGFFLSKFESKLDGVDGSTQRFKRYMDEGKKFVEEIVTFDNVKMQVRQRIRKDKRGRLVEKFRLLEDKVMDPLTMLYRFRTDKIEKIGEKRKYRFFADGFWDAEVLVLKKEEKKYSGIGKRWVWVIEVKFPKYGLLLHTGQFLLEIDYETGIMLKMEMDTGKGRCKFVIREGENSPLPF